MTTTPVSRLPIIGVVPDPQAAQFAQALAQLEILRDRIAGRVTLDELLAGRHAGQRY